eukprot:jgi/Ulvmu1/6882/UM031_0087.1
MNSLARYSCLVSVRGCGAAQKPCKLPVTFGRRDPACLRAVPPESETRSSLRLPRTANEVAEKPSKIKQLVQKIRSYGPAGIAAYGVLTTVYYSVVVAFVWLAVLHVAPGGGWQFATRKLIEAFAYAWAISQITKIPRAVGALFLAPIADNAMDWVIDNTWFQTKTQVLVAVTLASFVFALSVAGLLLLTAV